MNTDKRRELFEVISLIVVVSSLLILIFEIRQNTDALYAQTRQAILIGSLQELLLQFDNPDIALSIIKEDPLTPEELIRLDAFLSANLRAREFSWLQYQDGVVDDGQFETEVAVVQWVFDSSRVRLWWDNLGRGTFSTEFARFIDNQLALKPPTDTLWPGIASWDDE